MKVTKTGYFEMAHMLSGYIGDCKNLHGHSYRYEITVEGDTDEMGMVLDFNRIKRIVNNYDHCVCFAAADIRGLAEQELYDWAVKAKMKYEVMPAGQRPTCENLAAAIGQEIEGEDAQYVEVKLWETATGCAVWTNRDPAL